MTAAVGRDASRGTLAPEVTGIWSDCCPATLADSLKAGFNFGGVANDLVLMCAREPFASSSSRRSLDDAGWMGETSNEQRAP